MNRSSCASGRGYVPSCSIGFCVARTKNGRSRLNVSLPTVTCFSCIACSRAAWVLGGVRLISSARMMLPKIGPLINRNMRLPVPESSSRISVPVMSDGMRSGVNWMREKSSSSASATVDMSRVFASPGTPTSKQCPPANSAVSNSSITLSCPTITLAISLRSFLYASLNCLTSSMVAEFPVIEDPSSNSSRWVNALLWGAIT